MRLTEAAPIYPARAEGLAFVPPFLEGHGEFVRVCDEDLAPTVRMLGGLHVSPRQLIEVTASGWLSGAYTEGSSPVTVVKRTQIQIQYVRHAPSRLSCLSVGLKLKLPVNGPSDLILVTCPA